MWSIESTKINETKMSETTRKRKLIHKTPYSNDKVLHNNNPLNPLNHLNSYHTISAQVTSKPSGTLNVELLRMYYDLLFPYHWFVEWLSPNDLLSLPQREISFTLERDIYIRYQSITSRDELKKALVNRLPYKIDIGAVFNASPALHNSVNNFAPVSKELVFDVDMTDYDNVRTCCQEGNICDRCWPFVTAAIKVVESALRDDFGFQHLLWVYSGRRGVHCWVCDPRAKVLTNEQRTAIVEYLSLHLGVEQGKQKSRNSNLTFPLHPMLARALEQVTPFFNLMVTNQHWFEDHKSQDRFLNYFEDSVRDELKFSDTNSGTQNWELLKRNIQRILSGPTGKNATPDLKNSLKTAEARIVLGHVYPRLDVNVSKQMNHLLKSPFCVHPKTSRVCVPIDPENVENFNYLEVPTLEQLEFELNTSKADPSLKPNERTSLNTYVVYFKRFVQALQEQARSDIKIKAQTS